MYNVNLEEFMNELIINVTDRLGDSVRINKTEILKNNSVRYHGLVLSREGNNISPTIYVDELYKNYIRGASMDDLAVEIVNVYCKHSEKVNFVNIEYEIQFLTAINPESCKSTNTICRNEIIIIFAKRIH